MSGSPAERRRMPAAAEALRLWMVRASVQQKIRLLPMVAAVSLLVVLLLTVSLGLLNERRLARVQRGALPELRSNVALRSRLAGVERALRAAVESHDALHIAEADSLSRAFTAAAAGQALGGGDDQGTLRADFAAYYAASRAAAVVALGRGDARDSRAAAAEAPAHYEAVTRTLDAGMARDEAAIASTFTSATLLQRATWLLVGLATLAGIALLGTLSVVMTRALTDPIRVAADAADKLAVGDTSAAIGAAGDDELGQLLRSMDSLVRYLDDMARTAAGIGAGDVGVELQARSDRDGFGLAFTEMLRYLRSMASVAERISKGEAPPAFAPSRRSDAVVAGRACALIFAPPMMSTPRCLPASGL